MDKEDNDKSKANGRQGCWGCSICDKSTCAIGVCGCHTEVDFNELLRDMDDLQYRDESPTEE